MNEFTQAQLVRLISEMIQIGHIVEVQANPLRYKVEFSPNLITDWIPSDVGHAAQVKDFAPHQVGEQVLVIKSFNTQGGTIIGSLNQAAFDQPKEDLNLFYREFPDGTWLQYDMVNHQLSGKCAGDVQLHVMGNTMVHADQNLTVTSGGTMEFESCGNMSFKAPRIDWN